MGARVRKMESRVAALFDKKYGVMVNSGSSANYLAVALLKLPAGSEVITPAITFATTVAPIARQKLVPAFVDAADGPHNIHVDQLEPTIPPHTSANILTSMGGTSPDWT